MKNVKLLALVLAILMLFTICALGSGSDDSDSKAKVESGDNKTTAAADEKDEGPIKVKVGDTLTADGLKITFVSVEDFTDYDEWDDLKDGYKFIVLSFECENTSKDDKIISVYDFECYADDKAVEAHYEDDDISLTLSSGRKGSGKVYFEVPADAESIEVEYETDFWSNEKAIFVVK